MIENLSCLLLSGGVGTRMKSDIPKQYLPLGGKPIVLWSYEVLVKKASEMVVVAEQKWRGLFSPEKGGNLIFAAPGARRQDSVYHGFLATSHEWILIHDGARPFIEEFHIDELFSAAKKTGSAALATKSIATLRRQEKGSLRWIDREEVYEMQTPQLLHRDLLEQGLHKAMEEEITVTDDVAFAELLSREITLVEGGQKNIKITSEKDLAFAQFLLTMSTYAAL